MAIAFDDKQTLSTKKKQQTLAEQQILISTSFVVCLQGGLRHELEPYVTT